MSKTTEIQGAQLGEIQKKTIRKRAFTSLIFTVPYAILLQMIARYTSLVDNFYLYQFLMIFGTSTITLYYVYYRKH